MFGFFLFLVPKPSKTTITLVGGVEPVGEVWLTEIKIDGKTSNLNDYKVSGNWQRVSNCIVFIPGNSDNGSKLELPFPNAKNVELTFGKHAWSGGIGIFDGDSYIEYNLYAQSGEQQYEVQSVQELDYDKIKGGISVALLSVLIFLLNKIYVKCSLDNSEKVAQIKRIVLFLAWLIAVIALGALSAPFSVLIWFLLFCVFGIKLNNIDLKLLWISLLVSYIYYLYYLFNPYILSATNVFSVLLLINIFYSIKLGTEKRWTKYLIMIVTPGIMFIMMEVISNINILNLSPLMVIVNICILALCVIIIANLFQFRNSGWYISYIVAFILSVANYYVMQFKKYAMSPADILQIKTALAVAGDYQYSLAGNLVWGTLIFIFGIVLISMYIPCSDRTVKSIFKSKVIALIGVFVLIGWIQCTDFEKSYHITWNDWDTREPYSKNGFVVSFITAFQKMQIEKPGGGYSGRLAEQILESYTTNSETKGEKPIIIAIMNESFSDLNDLGSLGNTQDVMWYWNSLDCLEKGRTYVSVRGGGTCNSEFEFLTGNSLEFYSNIYPYTQFDFSDVPTLVSCLKEQGYKTVAMHAANPTNYGRQSVYHEMGFDEFYSFDSYAQYEKVFLDRTSDVDNYREILRTINETNEPLFIFNVTIQNHGDYDLSTLNPKYELIQMDEQLAGYTVAQMYLTLINESNKALKYLIEELEQIERPVILCMFGDHQPGCLESSFEDDIFETDANDSELYTIEKRYKTPYFIWSNYVDKLEDNKYDEVSSPNYLAAKLLKYAGVKTTEYQEFLLDMENHVLACNAFGYLGDDGVWHLYSEDNQYSEWFEKYRILQYYNMFDDNVD